MTLDQSTVTAPIISLSVILNAVPLVGVQRILTDCTTSSRKAASPAEVIGYIASPLSRHDFKGHIVNNIQTAVVQRRTSVADIKLFRYISALEHI